MPRHETHPSLLRRSVRRSAKYGLRAGRPPGESCRTHQADIARRCHRSVVNAHQVLPNRAHGALTSRFLSNASAERRVTICVPRWPGWSRSPAPSAAARSSAHSPRRSGDNQAAGTLTDETRGRQGRCPLSALQGHAAVDQRSSPRAGWPAGRQVRPPQRDVHQPGVYQLQAVEELGDVLE
jgi:hypothetical protein